MKIPNEVANVLAESRTVGELLYLPPGQLERNLYLAVNKVLEALKGKWNRQAKAHVFPMNIEDAVEEVLMTGEYTNEKNEFQFFETPTELASEMVRWADIQPGDTVLEPNAGRGAIALEIARITRPDCIELNQRCRSHVMGLGFHVVGDDFLDQVHCYDHIIANPPFTKQQDITHCTLMIRLARKSVISVMSASVLFRENKKTVEFRELVESNSGTIEPLPEKTFAESGTNVNTCMLKVRF